MLNLVMLILSNKQKISIFDIHNPTVLLIFTILLNYYCFLVQWTTQMVTILESRCPIFISMKPKITTLNSYNNKIRQTQKQLNKYNSTTTIIIILLLLLQPKRALSRSDYYYYHFALTKPSCSISMLLIFGLIKTAHSLQRQSTDDKNNDENENCTNPTQKTKKKKTNPFSIFGLLLISATKISMMIKMMKAKKYLLSIFFQNPQFNLFSSFRLSFSQKLHKNKSYARYMYKKMMLKNVNLILLFFE